MAPQNVFKGITPRLVLVTALVALVCIGTALFVVSFREYDKHMETKKIFLLRICNLGFDQLAPDIMHAMQFSGAKRGTALAAIHDRLSGLIPDLAYFGVHGSSQQDIAYENIPVPPCDQFPEREHENHEMQVIRYVIPEGILLICCHDFCNASGELLACARAGIMVTSYPQFLGDHIIKDAPYILSALLIATLLSAALIAGLTRPLRSVASYAQAIERGELQEKLIVTGHDEAGTIAEALNLVLQRLRQSYVSTLAALATLLESKDPSTESHSMRGVGYALELGRAIGLSDQQLMDLEYGAYLHDIGKVGVDDSILKKTGELTEEDWRVMRQHPAIGYAVLKNLEFLQNALPVVLYHQERYDGKGYPHGVRGEEIPLLARIFSIADAFDAMTSSRPYRPAMKTEQAIQEIRRNANGQFDPHLAQVFVKLWEKGRLDHVKGQPGLDILSGFKIT